MWSLAPSGSRIWFLPPSDPKCGHGLPQVKDVISSSIGPKVWPPAPSGKGMWFFPPSDPKYGPFSHISHVSFFFTHILNQIIIFVLSNRLRKNTRTIMFKHFLLLNLKILSDKCAYISKTPSKTPPW